jgi:hypothetical protein
LILSNNGGQLVSVLAGASSFSFPASASSGSSYNVTVKVQPSGRTCVISNGTGTVTNSDVTSVVVDCSPPYYTLGGTISGLTANGLQLATNGQTVSPLAGSTLFTFPVSIASGVGYTVSVQTQPLGLICRVVTGGSGVITTNITNVSVACSPLPTFTLSWGPYPLDLDTYVTLPTGAMVSYHDKGTLTQSPYVMLSGGDITNGYGPETIAISKLMVGTYRYAVRNYSGSTDGSITQSPALVRLAGVGANVSFSPPVNEPFPILEGSPINTVWSVFNMIVSPTCGISIATVATWSTNEPVGTTPTAPVYCAVP